MSVPRTKYDVPGMGMTFGFPVILLLRKQDFSQSMLLSEKQHNAKTKVMFSKRH